MKEGLSFRTALLASFCVLLFLAMLVPSWFYYQSIARAVTEEAINGARKGLETVEWLLEHGSDIRSLEEMHQRIAALAARSGMRITRTAADGRVLLDSEAPLNHVPEMETLINRPEIVAAGTQEMGLAIRYSRNVQQEYIFVARKMPADALFPPGFLRIAVPFSNVKEVLQSLRRTFFLVVAILFLAAALLTHSLILRLRSPMKTLTEGIRAIGGLDFKRRIRFSPDQEFYSLANSVNQMAENIDRHLQGISEEKQRLEAVFDGMQEGVMVLDSQGKILSINKALAQMVDYPPLFKGKRPIELIMSLELQESCERLLKQGGAREESPRKLQIELGDGRIYDVTIVKVEHQEGGMGATVVFHDISELKRLERVRQDFVANVSHEMRTPLTSIKGYTESLLLAEEPDPSILSSFLKIILRNCNHMVKMVDDLLQLARLEALKAPIKASPSNPLEALMAAWRTCSSLAEAKGVTLVHEIPAEGVAVSCDFDQLVQVFRNLLENSIRHSLQGGTVSVGCSVVEEAVQFSVRDDGPGIPKQYQQRVFERFFRIERHRGNDSGSTGLGLAICRHITKNHGGQIWVQSPNPGGVTGSTFFFTLPRATREDLQGDTALPPTL
ncbi:MAG: PAS domain S-box protein [Deltaproteobacteria bacterium]|nr:PAS domain S-box protein [Deltaproteobacteria bacterium]